MCVGSERARDEGGGGVIDGVREVGGRLWCEGGRNVHCP